MGWGEVARFTATGPGAVRGGGRLVAVVRGRAGRARRGRAAEGSRPGRVHQLHVRRRRAGLGASSSRAWSSAARGPWRGSPSSRTATGCTVQPVRPVRRTGRSAADGRLPVEGYRAAVAEAVRRMRAGELDKVVLAHDLLAVADAPLDAALPARRAGAALPVVLVVRRGRAGRRDARAADAPQRRDGVVAGAGRARSGRRRATPADRRGRWRGGCCRRRRTGASTRWRSSRSPRRCARCARSWTCRTRPGRSRCTTCRTWPATCTASWTATTPRRCCGWPRRCTRRPRWAAPRATPRWR